MRVPGSSTIFIFIFYIIILTVGRSQISYFSDVSFLPPAPAIYELFCSVKRKEFQILTWCKFLFGIKGWRGRKGSTTNCHEAPVNPSYVFLVHGKEQSTIQTMQPNFLNFPGPELSPHISKSFSRPTGLPCPLSNLSTFPVFPRRGSAPVCHHPGSHACAQNFYYVIWFLLCRCPAEEFPLLLPGGIQYWTGSTRGEIILSFLRVKSPQQQSPVECE